jgi:hypothetical protein
MLSSSSIPYIAESVKSVAWVEGERQIYSLGTNKNIRVYDCRMSSSAVSLLTKDVHVGYVEGMHFNTMQHHMLLTHSSNDICLWDIRKSSDVISDDQFRIGLIHQFNKSKDGIAEVKWSPYNKSQFAVLGHTQNKEIQFFSTVVNASSEVEVRDAAAFPTLPNAESTDVQFRRYSNNVITSFDWGNSYYWSGAGCNPERIFAFSGATAGLETFPVYPSITSSLSSEGKVSFCRNLLVHTYNHGERNNITVVMRQRAVEGYGLDPSINKKLFLRQMRTMTEGSTTTLTPDDLLYWLQRQYRLWEWLERCSKLIMDSTSSVGPKLLNGVGGLVTSGVCEILSNPAEGSEAIRNAKLGCTTYRSDQRTAALSICGWTDLNATTSWAESMNVGLQYLERAAALAAFHSDLAAARNILMKVEEKKSVIDASVIELYKIVAATIAGYAPKDRVVDTSLWDECCSDLIEKLRTLHHPYLVALLEFLLALHMQTTFNAVYDNPSLSWCDRAGFVIRFVNDKALYAALGDLSKKGVGEGEIDALPIVGLTPDGLKLLIKYVSETADVQTAAFVASYFPVTVLSTSADFANDWIESYRELLNTWKLWHVRAKFDVQRRCSKKEEVVGGLVPAAPENDAPAPTITIDCLYCNKSISLNEAMRQNRKFLNSHSKSKSKMLCCYYCKKALPRCSVCLLNMGAINPYLEEVFQQNKRTFAQSSYGEYKLRASSRQATGGDAQQPSQQAHVSIPFNDWWVWCQKCKHGGHSSHLHEWFELHDVCPVSECPCTCLKWDKHDQGMEVTKSTVANPLTPTLFPSVPYASLSELNK